MAFRASSLIPARGLELAKSYALDLKALCDAKVSEIGASGINGQQLIALWKRLAQARDNLVSVESISGIAAYAQAQENDATYDVATAFSALVSQVNSTLSWLDANVPKDANGYRLLMSLDANGAETWRVFVSPATDGLVTQLQAISAAIS